MRVQKTAFPGENKKADGGNYFDELLAGIRAIRSSEKLKRQKKELGFDEQLNIL